MFFRGEYLAVRNDKEGFFLCQAHQNIHRASKKIKIQWLSENEKSKNDKGDIYIKEFYDTIGESACSWDTEADSYNIENSSFANPQLLDVILKQ